jgi:hypothetical protein
MSSVKYVPHSLFVSKYYLSFQELFLILVFLFTDLTSGKALFQTFVRRLTPWLFSGPVETAPTEIPHYHSLTLSLLQPHWKKLLLKYKTARMSNTSIMIHPNIISP